MVGLALRKQLGNLQLAQRTQKTEILHIVIQILGHIIPEIALKLNGLAVLVVDVRPRNGAFVGAVLIGKRDVSRPTSKRHQNADKGQQSRKWRVAVEVALCVEFQHGRVERAVDDDKLVFAITCCLDAVQSGTTGIHNQRNDRHFLAQAFQSDDGVLAATNGNQHLLLKAYAAAHRYSRSFVARYDMGGVGRGFVARYDMISLVLKACHADRREGIYAFYLH